ncbi:hypothetical protein [Sphingomonas sp. YL-JM2C]
MLNAFQRACAQHYADGDFAHVETLDQVREQGDTLFTFLMVELSSSEDCDGRDESVRRVDTAIDNLRDVLDALQAMDDGMTGNPAPAPAIATVTLRFCPQAWIRDHAVAVDCEHPDSWTVPLPGFLDQFPTPEEWHENHDLRDGMRAARSAPRWIRDWSGPFEVELAGDQDPWSQHAADEA